MRNKKCFYNDNKYNEKYCRYQKPDERSIKKNIFIGITNTLILAKVLRFEKVVILDSNSVLLFN